MNRLMRLSLALGLLLALSNCSKCGGFLDLGLGKPAACGQKASPAS